MSDATTHLRQMNAVIASASRACDGNAGDTITALIGAVATIAASLTRGEEILTIAINSLEIARREVEKRTAVSLLCNAPGGAA